MFSTRYEKLHLVDFILVGTSFMVVEEEGTFKFSTMKLYVTEEEEWKERFLGERF